jgi:hypothetical protein
MNDQDRVMVRQDARDLMANAPIKRWRLLRRLFETSISALSINY